MIRHILKKDLLRLMFPTAVTLALLTALTVLDSQRYDYQASLAESILNILLPLAWASLIALAVHQEPLISDTAFWLTWPYRRRKLFGAKFVFAVLTVHVPLFLAQAWLLHSHGFAPFSPELWWKQGVVLLSVTIPALALASVTSTLTAFGWSALSLLTIVLVVDASRVGRRFPWMFTEWMPAACAILLFSIGATGILAIQYAKRTVWLGRVLAAGAGLGAVFAYAFLPRDWTTAWQCSVEPNPPRTFTATLDPGESLPWQMTVPWERIMLAFPLRVTGLEPDSIVWVEQLSVRLTGAAGEVWTARRSPGLDRRAWWIGSHDENRYAQALTVDRAFFGRVANGPARVDGRVSIWSFRQGAPRVLRPPFHGEDAPGVGRCSSMIQTISFGRGMLKVVCESTAPTMPRIRVVVVDPRDGREWRHGLGDAGSLEWPKITWLSSLQRRQTFFHIVERDSGHAGDRWLVPRDVLTRAQIRIEPVVPEGCVNLNYSFSVPDLTRWQIRDRTAAVLRRN